jgi:hypothetical protein
LVAEVIATASELGFRVVDVDEEISKEGDRREDLRIIDPDDAEWTALAEVRGYTKGAQLNDLLRLARFVSRYIRDESREPDAVWYVVNHFLGMNPSLRPAPLESNVAEVETFGEGGGLVIDTRDLFRLRMRVRRGETTPAEARALLRGARRRLELK